MSQFCTNCGAENLDRANFCKDCGKQLKTEEMKRLEAEEKEKAEKEKYSKIGGWLTFFGFILVVGNISWLVYIVNTYVGDEFINSIEALYINSNEKQVSYLNMLVAIELLEYFVLLLLTINFFMKSAIARIMMIIYSIVIIVGVPVSIFLLYQINPNMSEFSGEIGKMIGSVFWIIIWLFYFIFSKRVKKTFIEREGIDTQTRVLWSIFFALLLPLFFAYKYYNSVEEIQKSANDTTSLMMKVNSLVDAKKIEEALPYLYRASDLGDARAQGYICIIYISGDGGITKNLDTAIDWCYKSYKTTNEKEVKEIIATQLGNIYLEKEDFTNGKIWYTEALTHVDTEAKKATLAEQIGDKYFNAKHFTTSAYWYQKAVDLGNDDAKFRLTYLYKDFFVIKSIQCNGLTVKLLSKENTSFGDSSDVISLSNGKFFNFEDKNTGGDVYTSSIECVKFRGKEFLKFPTTSGNVSEGYTIIDIDTLKFEYFDIEEAREIGLEPKFIRKPEIMTMTINNIKYDVEKHPYNFLTDNRFKNKFIALVGNNYDDLRYKLSLASFIEDDGTYYIGEGCAPHQCNSQGAIFTINKSTGEIIVGMYSTEYNNGIFNSDIKYYGKNKNLPSPIVLWAKRFEK